MNFIKDLQKMEARAAKAAKGRVTHSGNEFFRSHSFCTTYRGNCSTYGIEPAKRREVFHEHRVGLTDQALGYLEAYA